MRNQAINTLLEALTASPDNIPLRLQLAHLLLQNQQYTEAGEQFQQVLHRSYGNEKAQLGLAECYYHLQKFSAAIIIYETAQEKLALPDQVRFIKCLIKENALQQAADLYQSILITHPHFYDAELDACLHLPAVRNEPAGEEEESVNAAATRFFMQKPKERFSHVGGMKRVKEEIALKIIEPLKNAELYKAFGKKIGGGILLYGPPGCGKTYIARATAGEINARFITIGLHDILDMWVGNSEKNIHDIFELARKHAPSVLFLDEVDVLGASRSQIKTTTLHTVVNQFLAEMDGVVSDNEGVLVLAATNAPWSIDAAFRRPGRFDRIIFVEPPDEGARAEIVKTLLQGKPAGIIDFDKVAQATPGCSGADLKAIVDLASEEKLRESMASNAIQLISTSDLLKAARQHRPTTIEWFASARNYALYANESGLYNDILSYLKIRK